MFFVSLFLAKLLSKNGPVNPTCDHDVVLWSVLNQFSAWAGADPGFFLGRGAPLRNDVTDGEVKKKEIKTEHVYTKTKASFQREGGVRTPCILLLDLSLW